MEIINSDPIQLSQASYNYHKDDSKQTNLFYHRQCSSAKSSPVSSADQRIYKLHSGLIDKNWNSRERALKKLLQFIPNLDLDMEVKLTRDILRLVTLNLGHMVSSVRKGALEVILAFIKYSKQPENVVENVIWYGVDTANIDTNLSLNTIQTLPVILKQVRFKCGHFSHQLLARVVCSLSKRMVQITHQRQVMTSLLRIKNLIGDSMFDHFLETYYPQIKRDFDVLCNVYDDRYSDVSDDFSDVEESELNDDSMLEMDANMNSDDDVIMKVYDEDGNEIKRTSSRRVTFGGEIVKIRTPDSEGTNVNNSDNTNDKIDISADIVIQVSSDESTETVNDQIKLEVSSDSEKNSCFQKKTRKLSQIPIPIRPARNKPRHPRHPFPTFRQPSIEPLNGSQSKSDEDTQTKMNYDGDSMTSSSGGSDPERSRLPSLILVNNNQQKAAILKNNTLQDLARMKINDKLVLENLFKKDDWRSYICGAERLAQILRQPYCIQTISSNIAPTTGISLLGYIFNVLAETKNNRVIISSLRVLRHLCQAMQLPVLGLYLDVVMPKFCSYLGCAHEYTVRIEAVELVKMLMRKFSPQRIVDVLFSEHCFFAKSSKIRENSLLCLMYALITFPSTEFNMNEITDVLIKHGIFEQKRRVRQALLDALSILGQLVPKSKFQISETDEESAAFKRALRARLTRRQLPTVSQSGLIFYAFQISPATAFGTDIEWILAGKGSLSDNYNKSKTKLNYVYNNDISPIRTDVKWSPGEKDKHKKLHQTRSSVPTFIQRGSSELVLPTKDRYPNMVKSTNNERFSAGWTESKSSTSLFEPIYRRYSSNLSDTSSYESSHASDFPRLYPGYEPRPLSLDRPFSEDKLNQLPWSRNYSKHSLKMNSVGNRIPIYYGYDSSASLPVLNDRKDQSFKHICSTTEKVHCYSSDENRYKLSKSREKFENNFRYESKLERGKRESCTNKSRENHHTNQNHPPDGNHADREDKLNILAHEIDDESGHGNNDQVTATIPSVNNQFLRISSDSTKSYSSDLSGRSKNFLERKAGVKLKRSLTKEIRIPQSTFSLDPTELPPFEFPKDGLQRTLLQFESREWETVIEALQGVIRLIRHHSKQLSACLHPYAIAVSKEIRSLRSQVARAACLAAEFIFSHMDKISDQDIEELSHALFLRTADTNKFLREDSNKALDAMIDNIKFSKCILLLTQKVANHSNAMIRASAARLLGRLIQKHGPSKILSLTKEKKELVINTIVKFVMDGNLQTRTNGKQIFQLLSRDRKMNTILSEMIPSSVLSAIHRSLSRMSSSN